MKGFLCNVLPGYYPVSQRCNGCFLGYLPPTCCVKSLSAKYFIGCSTRQLPIIPVLYGLTTLEIISKLLVPVAMVVIGLRIRKPKELLKGLIYFNLLAAVCGGIYYVFAGWLNLSTEEVLFTANDLGFAFDYFATGGGYNFGKNSKRSLLLDKILYTVEISFGPNSNF